MARPRKRKHAAPKSQSDKDHSFIPRKRLCILDSTEQHPVLSQFYPQLERLRDYVISRLPSSSRIRRKKVAAMGIAVGAPLSEIEQSLGNLLDTTWVGLSRLSPKREDGNADDWKDFSQIGNESYVTLSNGVAGFVESQALIVEFVIRTLFKREKSSKWPDHLLCDGFRRQGALGVRPIRPNQCVDALQGSPWPELLALLGESGDRIMIDLLLECSIFIPIGAGMNNICQISGKHLSNVSLYHPGSTDNKGSKPKGSSELVIVRNRMFYARPALNAHGQVHFGLRHIHVLNRSRYHQLDYSQSLAVETQRLLTHQNDTNTLRVMMYIFPRQFGLHNVFTSNVNFKETSQRLKDYTLREEEISEKFGQLGDETTRAKIPKRLRGETSELVRRLQILHQRCSYSRLLQNYCPVRRQIAGQDGQVSDSSKVLKQVRRPKSKAKKRASQLLRLVPLSQLPQDSSVVELATPATQVSTFCQAVLRKMIPQKFWGPVSIAEHNEGQFLKKVDQFISLRRFEGMSLHEVTQGIKIVDIAWLAPPKLMVNKPSLTDLQKRQELFDEFAYFLFDSVVIPLIRSNFYVTESNTDKYRVFFFRHDIWRSLVEPAVQHLKGRMLEEVSFAEAQDILRSRQLGFSQIRLLPKGPQMRPITNLRRRAPARGNPKELGLGINKILEPVHAVLQLEKMLNPHKMGSTLFSVGDIYKRLKPFKSSMSVTATKFYFAKVDVQSAFDTIPQAAIVSLLDSIPQQRQYRVSRHLEVGPSLVASGGSKNQISKPMKKWPSVAIKDNDPSTFIQRLEDGRATTKRNTIFMDLYQKTHETSELLQLVASHVQQNLVKIGKKYYRQREGIPQGSILSSMLCNYFYADLEAHVLPFLKSNDCLLLRLTDDFLLITTDRSKAAQFVEILHHGVPEYGVTVNPAKTLVNFDLEIDHERVSKLEAAEDFPYCGTLINTSTLDIARVSNHTQHKAIYNSLTVEYTRAPGQTFQRKVLNSFKIQSHLMFFDTGLNLPSTMLNNVGKAFSETATKMWAYTRCLPIPKQPPTKLIIKTIARLVDIAYLLLTSKTRKMRYPDYVCDVKKCEVAWLAYNAFHKVLLRRQSKYSPTLAWLQLEMTRLSTLKDIRHGRVRDVV